MNMKEAIMRTKADYKNHEKLNEEKEVIEKYGSLFHPDNLDYLTKEYFKSFLLIKNNKHWDGIHRQGNIITKDMNKLKRALKILLNEEKSPKERLNRLFPKSEPNYIKGLGRAIVTPILLVVYPEKYGVYNNRTAEGLKKVGSEPKFNRGASFSEKYIKVNKVLNELSTKNNLTLYQLDNVWWRITEEFQPKDEIEKREVEETTGLKYEDQLRRLLVDNWEKTELNKEYEILIEDGDPVGEKFQLKEGTKRIGEIDILTRHRKSKDWVVIELKKGPAIDTVVGQTLRYMGWIEKNKIEKKEGVRGIIIVKEADEKLQYALLPLKKKVDIKCLCYNVKFSFKEVAI